MNYSYDPEKDTGAKKAPKAAMPFRSKMMTPYNGEPLVGQNELGELRWLTFWPSTEEEQKYYAKETKTD